MNKHKQNETAPENVIVIEGCDEVYINCNVDNSQQIITTTKELATKDKSA